MTNTDSDKPKVKDLELLTCSASDYAKNQGRELTAYEFVGINTNHRMSNEGNDTQCIAKRAKVRGCEVIVDLHSMMEGSWGYLAGTGLVLKTLNDEEIKK